MKLAPLAVAAALSLTACTPIKIALLRLEEDRTAYVYQNEYVIDAAGYWCEYNSHLRLASTGNMWCGDRPANPPGVYLVDAKGEFKLQASANIVELEGAQTNGRRECARYQSQGIECAPNFFINKLTAPTTDPLIDDLWGLGADGVGVQALWANGASSPNVRVAVIDTGVFCEHEDLGGCAGEYDAITGLSGANSAADRNGHGTHCAGTVLARGNNGRGISGVSQRGTLLAAKFMGANGGGSLYSAVKAIDWAVKKDAHIISASWGAPFGNKILERAIQRADKAGVLFVAAAGNDARDLDQEPQYPASYSFENMITVGSHAKDGDASWFSNWGSNTVEVFAPGTDILSTWNDGTYNSISGTSMATPHVAGLAALLWEKEIGQGTKREQMLRVKETILSMGSEELRDRSLHGIVRALPKAPPPDPVCEAKRCKKCVRRCGEITNCKKWARCRTNCRSKNNCNGGCR